MVNRQGKKMKRGDQKRRKEVCRRKGGSFDRFVTCWNRESSDSVEVVWPNQGHHAEKP